MKYKLFVPVVLALGGMALLYQGQTLRGLEEDRAFFGFEVAETVGQSMREELETLVKLRLEELSRLARELRKGDSEKVFTNATSDFRSDVLCVTSYTPNGDGTYGMKFATNRGLMKEKRLPPNSVFLMNQAAPLDVDRLARNHDVTVFNRSFFTDNGPVAVQSFVLYVKPFSGSPNGPILVADVLAENFMSRLRRSETVQAFLVTETGALLAHPDAEWMVEYRDAPYPGFPLEALPANWQAGARFAWKQLSREWLTLVSPTGMRGAYLTAQVQKSAFTQVLADLEREFWLGAGALLGVLALISFWLSGGVARNVRNTAAAAQALSKGDFDRVPKLNSMDEFLYVRDAFKSLQGTMKTRFREEFERGQKDSLLATIQTLRAAMGNANAGSFENWEVVTHRPNTATTHQEFWDFHQKGNRRQVIVGRANTDGVSGVLLAVLVRTTLDNVRRLSDRFSTQRPPTLGELLDIVNGALFATFKGRICLIATAFEVDLDTGAVAWVHAGGPGGLHIKTQGGDSTLDETRFSGKNLPLGARAVSSYQAATDVLAPGERLLVHAQSVQGKSAVGDGARDLMKKAMVDQGGKSLADMKTALIQSMENRVYAENLAFVAIRRPNGEESPSASVPARAA